MKVAVIGSRGFTDYSLMYEHLKDVDISLIISGGAAGADKLAERYADEHDIPKSVIPADWSNLQATPCKVKYNKYGKPYNAMAGFNRNQQMAEQCDMCVAFWDGESKGTFHMIQAIRKLGKDCKVVNF